MKGGHTYRKGRGEKQKTHQTVGYPFCKTGETSEMGACARRDLRISLDPAWHGKKNLIVYTPPWGDRRPKPLENQIWSEEKKKHQDNPWRGWPNSSIGRTKEYWPTRQRPPKRQNTKAPMKKPSGTETRNAAADQGGYYSPIAQRQKGKQEPRKFGVGGPGS